MGQVAEALGVSVVYVSDVEREKRDPFKGEKLANLARFLDVPHDELMVLAAEARGTISVPTGGVPRNARPALVSVLGRGPAMPQEFWDDFVLLSEKYGERP